jgi:EmrB/QacA subfamily drug resistance transporter
VAQNMPELISFRAVQGLGAGGLITVSIAVVGDVISPRDRGRYQGIFGAVFGVSTVIGPLLGGFFVDNLSWRWIFYVNLPVGALALVVIGAVFHSRAVRVEHKVDYLGAALLAAGLSCIVLFTSLGGTTLAWRSGESVTLIVLGVVLLVIFLFVERGAREPILPLELFRNRTFTVCAAIGFIIGLALFGAVTYLPLFLQIVKGRSPTSSGLQLTPMMAGLLVTSVLAGRLISKWGRYKPFPVAGTAVMTVGMVLLARLDIHSTTAYTSLAMVVLGLGLGMVMQVLVLAVQNAVDPRNMGVATSGALLFRQVGGSVGIAIFGAIFANRLHTELLSRLPPGTRLPKTVTPSVVAAMPAPLHEVYVRSVSGSLHPIFVVAACISTVAFLLTWLLRDVPLRESTRPLRGEELAGAAAAERGTVTAAPAD